MIVDVKRGKILLDIDTIEELYARIMENNREDEVGIIIKIHDSIEQAYLDEACKNVECPICHSRSFVSEEHYYEDGKFIVCFECDCGKIFEISHIMKNGALGVEVINCEVK